MTGAIVTVIVTATATATVTVTVTATASMIVIVAVWFKASTASPVTEGAIIALWAIAERFAWCASEADRPVLKDAPGVVTRTAFGWIVAAEPTSSSDADKAFKRKTIATKIGDRGSRIEDGVIAHRAILDPQSSWLLFFAYSIFCLIVLFLIFLSHIFLSNHSRQKNVRQKNMEVHRMSNFWR
jgi:hypothetical protein